MLQEPFSLFHAKCVNVLMAVVFRPQESVGGSTKDDFSWLVPVLDYSILTLSVVRQRWHPAYSTCSIYTQMLSTRKPAQPGEMPEKKASCQKLRAVIVQVQNQMMLITACKCQLITNHKKTLLAVPTIAPKTLIGA